MRVWRVASATHAAFDGEGARLYGSRWTPKGMPAVFASATLSLAALERFVNVDTDLEPPNLVAIAVDIGTKVTIESVAAADWPDGWRSYPAPASLLAIGERWLCAASSAVLSVPSTVIPAERNFILNPRHPDFARVIIHSPEPFSFNPRMWKSRGGG